MVSSVICRLYKVRLGQGSHIGVSAFDLVDQITTLVSWESGVYSHVSHGLSSLLRGTLGADLARDQRCSFSVLRIQSTVTKAHDHILEVRHFPTCLLIARVYRSVCV